MTLRARLVLAMGGVTLLLILPATYAVVKLSELRDIASDVGSSHGVAYESLGLLQARLSELDRLTRAYVAVPDVQTRASIDTSFADARSAAARMDSAGYDRFATESATQLDAVDAIMKRIDPLILENRKEEATDEIAKAASIFARSDSILDALGPEIDRRVDEELALAARISAAATTTTLLALVACLFIATLLGVWTAGTLVRPIHRLRHATAAVAAGEFVVPVDLPYDRTDELGDLSRSFRGMTQHLADLERMKADFMSIATHELKTPINVVSGYSELIQEGVYGEVTEKQNTALTAIREQSRLMTQLVNQLLDISRLEAGGMKLEFGDMLVSDLFDRIRRTFDVLAHKQQIELVVDLDRSAPRTIPADADRLRDQVFGNLLANALKFTPAGGRIAVRGWKEREWLCVEVKDTGEGMPESQLPHVFDKYFQIGEQARSKGAGLGLTIAHEIVVAHGGEIKVVSEPGAGTTFCVQLPATLEARDAAIAKQKAVGTA